MKPKNWKKLQRLAYGFYMLIYVHIMFLMLPMALTGNITYLIDVIVYSIVFIGYGTLKLKKYYKKSKKPIAIVLIVAMYLALGTAVTLNLVDFSAEKEDESLWNIGITDPYDTSEINITLQTAQNSVVITGAYERFFEEDGEVYHHIFNSSTGYPTDEDIKSVTVVSENSTLADIYATALFAMGYEEAIAFAESEESIDVVIIRDDNTVYVSDILNVTLGEKYAN